MILPLKLRLLEALDRRLGHRVRILCHICAYWNHLSWKEAGEAVRMDEPE